MLKCVKAVLLDLNGTLNIGDQPTVGAVAALERLRQSGLPIRFVTNTTKESRSALQQRLNRVGFSIAEDEIFTALRAARTLLEQRKLKPYFLMEDEALRNEFSDMPYSTEADGSDANAVVVALAPSKFNYGTLNHAFHVLEAGHPLIAVHKARRLQDTDGPALGPGPFVEALEYASGVKAEVVGKPEAAFFHACLAGLDCQPEDAVMIGDDVCNDVLGALKAGLQGILVKTGKYRVGDENALQDTHGTSCESFSAAVETLLSKQ